MKSLLVVLILVTSTTLLAQWNPNPSVNTPIDTGFGRQWVHTLYGYHWKDQNVLTVNDSALYIVWIKEYPRVGGTYPYQLFVQSLTMNGIKRFGEGISVTDTLYSWSPQAGGWTPYSITKTFDGGFYLAYVHTPYPLTGFRSLRLKKYNQYGIVQWERVVSTQDALDPYIIADSQGNAVLAWLGRPDSIFVQRYNTTGLRAWNRDAYIAQNLNSIEGDFLSLGRYGYILSTDPRAPWPWRTRISRIDTSGNTFITTDPDSVDRNKFNHLIPCDTSSFFLITTKNQRTVRMRRWRGDLTPLWPQSKDVLTVPGYSYSEVVSDMKNGFFFAWTDSTGHHFIRLDSTGRMLWQQPVSWRTFANSGGYFELISDSSGGAMVFIRFDSDTSKKSSWYNIAGQRIDSSGNLLWGQTGRIISSRDAIDLNVISDNHQGAFLVWTAITDTNNTDVYATRVTPNGLSYPVELFTFTASRVGKYVQLHWQTATETNNAGFEIERAENPEGIWHRVGYIPGMGSSTSLQQYEYSDPLSPALLQRTELFYRLRQIDYDGSAEYSPVARVLINPPTSIVLEPVHPNPARDLVTARFALPGSEALSLSVYDVLGREVVRSEEKAFQAGVHAEKLNLKKLPAGVYYVVLNASVRLVRPFVIAP